MSESEKRIAVGPAARSVMRNVRRYREMRSLTYKELAEALADVGRPIAPLGLSRIERGDRRVDVDDLIALAKVLGVSPVMLVFPLGQERTVEVLPGQHVPAWEAVKWFIGHGPFPPADVELADFMATYKLTLPVQLYTVHDGLVFQWLEESRRALVLRQMPQENDEARAELRAERILEAERRVRELENALAKRRGRMRKTGWLPPLLPTELAHLDELAEGEVDEG